MSEKPEEFARKLRELAERLESCEQVRQYDRTGEKEAWTIAHAILDLSESFRTLLDSQFPLLEHGDLTSDQIYSLLIEIGEEFRHIMYHIQDPQFYSYLREEEPLG